MFRGCQLSTASVVEGCRVRIGGNDSDQSSRSGIRSARADALGFGERLSSLVDYPTRLGILQVDAAGPDFHAKCRLAERSMRTGKSVHASGKSVKRV